MNKNSMELAISKHYSKIIKIAIFIFFLLYFLINIFSLTDYPFIHSDESWLSGLSRTILDKQSFNTSEPFFDLYPRPIHGLRIVFVLLQIMFIKTLGYSVFAVRLLSLLFGMFSLILIYNIIEKEFENKVHSLMGTAIIGFNIQFIMTSHVARQESIILFGMLMSYYLMTRKYSKYQFVIVASVIGIFMGVHPNSFLIGCGIGLIYAYKLINRYVKLKDILGFVLILTLFLSLFITVSLIINANFFNSYLAFGDSLGVIHNEISRVDGLFYYYYKLFHQIGGTYNLVNIKLDLVLLVLAVLLGLIVLSLELLKKIKHKDSFIIINSEKIIYPWLMLIGINLGYFIIGRYNQTAIIFAIVFSYITLLTMSKVLLDNFLLKHEYFSNMNTSIKTVILSVLVLAFSVYQLSNTINVVGKTDYQSYEALGETIKRNIPAGSKVLANLNLDYFFDNYDLFDYRNLTYLEDNNITFSEYIEKNDIEYIILSEEMEYIFNSNGKWDILYGDMHYYGSMVSYINENCGLIHKFENPTYGMRIAKYVDVYPWYTKIYKVSK